MWLDSFDQKWNSHYDGNGVAGQFWQMESAIRFITFESDRSQNVHHQLASVFVNFAHFFCFM